MTLHEDIRASLKDAMKAKEATRLSVIRNMITAFTNELVATGKKPQDILPDEEALGVIKRLAKQRKESIVQYEAAGRTESAEAEKAELTILESYLPTLMSKAEIQPIAEAKKKELNIEDKSKMGILMGALMKDLKGKADGEDVKTIVQSLFS